jgi:hypothetical protein
MTEVNSGGIEAMLVDYEATAVAWDAAREHVRKANRLFDRVRRLGAELAADETGRQGISKLMGHPSEAVRCAAAVDSLGWAPSEAVAVLKEIERGPGMLALDAEYTLIEYRAGRLKLRPMPAAPSTVGPRVQSRLLDAAEMVHNLAMNGGLDHAFEERGELFADAADGFTAVGAPDAASILRRVQELARTNATGKLARTRALAGLLTADVAELEELSSQFCGMDDLLPSLERATEADS